MSKKGYEHAPLLMALIDIKFSSIPNFYEDGKLIDVESSLRDIGFVEKVVENQQEFAFEIKHDQKSGQTVQMQKPAVSGQAKQRWIFLDLERTTSVYLAQNGVSIKTTHYTTHEEFMETFNNVLLRISDVFETMLKGAVSQIGTRFLNLIVPLPGNDVSRYIDEAWLPNNTIPEINGIESGIHSRLTMNYKTRQGNLRVESNKFSPEPGVNISIIPNELSDNPDSALNIRELPWWPHQLDNQVSYLILDIDLNKKLRKLFNVEEIMETLSDMRKVTKPAFEMCITDDARADWIIKEE
ncbi:MAG: TIGR04255 family protein [Vibrio sp.]|uniref:TIGR04255 family protein n=1 Tax=Vibrio sp. TaxID=678 RepID=UPI003A8BE863